MNQKTVYLQLFAYLTALVSTGQCQTPLYRTRYNGAILNTLETALATSQTPGNVSLSVYHNFYERIVMRPDITKLDLTILLDSSVSLGEQNYNNAKRFLSNLIGMMPPRDFASRIRTSMYTFSVSAKLTKQFGFGDIHFRELVRRNINRAQYQNGSYTHMTSALYWIDAFISRSARASAKKVLIIATDGRSNDDSLDYRGLNGPITDLINNGVEIYVVALGTNLDLVRISILASQPDSTHIFHLANRDSTNVVMRSLANTVVRHRS